MEATEDASQECGLCNKEVVCSGFALHESQCRQFTCLYSSCEELIPHEELDRHCQATEVKHKPVSMEDQATCGTDCHTLSLETTSGLNLSQAPSVPSITQRQTTEACWYCLKSLPPDMLKEHQLDGASCPPGPHGDERLGYQQDPRPHFGVPHSSRSTALPLWGNEGPVWAPGGLGAELEEEPTAICPHCHLALPPDTLRWHEVKCLAFAGLKPDKAGL